MLKCYAAAHKQLLHMIQCWPLQVAIVRNSRKAVEYNLYHSVRQHTVYLVMRIRIPVS
jgi:hypothetical protein